MHTNTVWKRVLEGSAGSLSGCALGFSVHLWTRGAVSAQRQKASPTCLNALWQAEVRDAVPMSELESWRGSACGTSQHSGASARSRLREPIWADFSFADPELELSNNLTENSMRGVAGRKHWIPTGSPEVGPKVAAILLLVETCRRRGIAVREYLGAVLPGLADVSIQRIAGLTPAAWAARNQ